jgi:hypothetical protein
MSRYSWNTSKVTSSVYQCANYVINHYRLIIYLERPQYVYLASGLQRRLVPEAKGVCAGQGSRPGLSGAISAVPVVDKGMSSRLLLNHAAPAWRAPGKNRFPLLGRLAGGRIDMVPSFHNNNLSSWNQHIACLAENLIMQA